MDKEARSPRGVTAVGNARVLGTLGPGFCGQKPMKKSELAGLQPTGTVGESTDADDSVEPIIDGGIPRRVFLRAGAVFTSLSTDSGMAATDGGNPDNECVSPKESDIDYGRQNVVNTSGGLELYVAIDEENNTSVTVASHPKDIGLCLSNEIGAMNVLLLPEAIELLCRELLDAKSKTLPEDVEHTCEWITEDHREGEADAGE